MEQATPHKQLDAAIRLYVLRKKAQVQQHSYLCHIMQIHIATLLQTPAQAVMPSPLAQISVEL